MKQAIIDKIRTAAKDPGVYIFYGSTDLPQAANKVLYVGKAANLRERLKSYLKITDLKTQSLHEEATRLSYIPLHSEIEALIEESRLIKELKPKYNILWCDDKSYLYVSFTKENFPKVFITHKNPKVKNLKIKTELIGPFTDGSALRLVMKLLRRYFPYCTCFQTHLRDCLNAQIGQCMGFCCKRVMANNAKTYRKNIHAIKMILRGQSKKLLKTLSDIKEREALEKIFEHQPFLYTVREHSQKHAIVFPSEKNTLALGLARPSDTPPARPARRFSQKFPNGFLADDAKIECYDVSNFAGKEAVGAMTVLVKKDGVWQADKDQWRKFKIKSAPTRDDPRMIYEVVSRRLRHTEWPYPDLIIIDGGITQYRAALKAQSENPGSAKIKITAYPKPQKHLLGWIDAPKEILQLAERAIYQTHNFVIRYHRKIRSKQMFAIMK